MSPETYPILVGGSLVQLAALPWVLTTGLLSRSRIFQETANAEVTGAARMNHCRPREVGTGLAECCKEGKDLGEHLV